MLMVTTTTRDGSESFDLHDLPIGETKALDRPKEPQSRKLLQRMV